MSLSEAVISSLVQLSKVPSLT